MLLETSDTNHSRLPKRVMSSLFSHHHSSKSLTPQYSLPSHSLSPLKLTSTSLSEMEAIIDAAEPIIAKWDLYSSTYTKVTSLFQHSRKEGSDFVHSVKELRRAMNNLLVEHSTSTKLVLAQQLMQIAMKRLEKELYQILSDNREQLDPESISSRSSMGSSSMGGGEGDGDGDENETRSSEELDESEAVVKEPNITEEVERVSDVAMADLKSIADCMIACGYKKECIKIYKSLRKSVIDEAMFRLKIERFRSSHIQKAHREALVGTINNWLNGVKIAVKSLFNGEKRLCDHIFSGSDTIGDSCFHEITKEAATNIFRFPEIVVKSRKSSPEKIFQLMELYETFSELWPDIETIFSSELTADIRSQALSSSLKLRDAIYTMLPDFETAIHKDYSSKALVPGGGIHPMTRSVMEYIASLSDHSGVLSGILADYPQPVGDLHMKESYLETPVHEGATENAAADAVSVHLAWLILVLLCKLDFKAELYKDVSLSYLFLANNLQFILEKVRSTSLKLLLGEEWIAKHAKKVQQYAASYESMAWTKVFFTLPDNNNPSSSPLSAAEAKECFKNFSAAFEEEHKKQTSWIVQDRKLRDDLKVSIARKLVPKYRDFFDSYSGELRAEKNVVRFSPDDLGNYLSDLFHGESPSGSFKSSSSSASSSSLLCLSH